MSNSRIRAYKIESKALDKLERFILTDFNKFGEAFTLIEFKPLNRPNVQGIEYKAIYIRENDFGKKQWEVMILRERLYTEFKPFRHLGYPSGSDWGNFGWTYNSSEKANLKYNQL